jgi:hypothetical protein
VFRSYVKALASLAVLATVAGGAAATEAATHDDAVGRAAASAGHKRCPTSGREIRAASRLVVVTYFQKVTTTLGGGRTTDALTFACWRSTGRERQIDGYDVVIAGAWVGYQSQSGYNRENDYTVTSAATDVRTGRSRQLDWDGEIYDIVADDMVLKPNGSFAILGQEHQSKAPVVAALDRDGGRTLSTSPDVVQGSLVLNGGSVSWREGPVRRSARLR